ncbi:efflux RND transporter periplasmic adaptor subunit [Neolewinella lacunae]|uniref:Efflux RND transporter periplasmic adaptor subunit n=1 Tax=Neolewinella lacunae TaxID=1517758 RepID=A0A923T927_9BACT|nr:HlyD family efflux transporter periplasmic adaptor subunit [Neolewinella lacunae]MBC6996265.1 efflux RND transporter periplasmic adaptor subunit [Neolewinella lacunae]MDN3636888.1 efflux RND transporter periplasmic adaptor subunit [Neolewinella lacunae]
MDRTIDTRTIAKRRNGRILKWGLLILCLLAGIYFGLRLLRPSADENKLRFATVERGEVLNTVNATALVLPAFEEQINASVGTNIASVLLRTGSEVKAGDLMMTLDRNYVSLQLDGRRDQLALKENNIGLLKLEYQRDLKDLGYDAEIKTLELAAAEARLADAQRLLKVGGATEEEVEAADLAVRITKLESEKLNNALAYSRNSLAGRERQLQLEVGMEEKEVQQLSRKLRETEVRAPRPGVITWVNENIGQRVEEGAPLVRIANLGSYKIEGSCSDRMAEQLSVGLPVELRLPKAKLSGHITAILPEVTDNTLRFRVELDEPSNENLRPNLRAELYVITDRREDVLRVRNGPAFRGGMQQSIFVLRGEEAVRTEVSTGLRNGDFVEITGGLEPGDRIIISATEDLERVSAFKINE